jgi:hypothetical protein
LIAIFQSSFFSIMMNSKQNVSDKQIQLSTYYFIF